MGEAINRYIAAERRRRPGQPGARTAHLGRQRHHRHPRAGRRRRRRPRRRPHPPAVPARRSSLRITAVAMSALALMPGMPKVPFFLLAVVLVVLSGRASRAQREDVEVLPAAGADEDDPDAPTEIMLEQVRVEPLELQLAPDLLDLLDVSRGGSLMERVRALRKRIAADLGLVVPPVRTHDAALLPTSTYVVRLHGVEAARGEAPPGHSMVLGEDAAGLPGRATVDPVFGLPATWVQNELAEVLASEGATVIDRASVIVTHLSEVVRSAAPDLLTRQDVQVLVDAVKTVSPVVAGEIGDRDAVARRGAAGAARAAVGGGARPRPHPHPGGRHRQGPRDAQPRGDGRGGPRGARPDHLRGRCRRRPPRRPHPRPAARAVAARGGPRRRRRHLARPRPGAHGAARHGHRRRRPRGRGGRPPPRRRLLGAAAAGRPPAARHRSPGPQGAGLHRAVPDPDRRACRRDRTGPRVAA